MCTTVQSCFTVNNVLLMRSCVSTSVKNGSSVSAVVGERFDMCTRQKSQREYKEGNEGKLNLCAECLCIIYTREIKLLNWEGITTSTITARLPASRVSLPASRKLFSCENKLGDRMIKQLLNSFIAKYRCQCLADQLFASAWQITIFCSTSSNNCYWNNRVWNFAGLIENYINPQLKTLNKL